MICCEYADYAPSRAQNDLESYPINFFACHQTMIFHKILIPPKSSKDLMMDPSLETKFCIPKKVLTSFPWVSSGPKISHWNFSITKAGPIPKPSHGALECALQGDWQVPPGNLKMIIFRKECDQPFLENYVGFSVVYLEGTHMFGLIHLIHVLWFPNGSHWHLIEILPNHEGNLKKWEVSWFGLVVRWLPKSLEPFPDRGDLRNTRSIIGYPQFYNSSIPWSCWWLENLTLLFYTFWGYFFFRVPKWWRFSFNCVFGGDSHTRSAKFLLWSIGRPSLLSRISHSKWLLGCYVCADNMQIILLGCLGCRRGLLKNHGAEPQV